MQVLAILTAPEGVMPDRFAAYQVAEETLVWQLQRDGQLRTIHYLIERIGVVLMFETASAEEARAIVAGLPMVEAGLLVADVLPLAPFTGIENLFAPEHRGMPDEGGAG